MSNKAAFSRLHDATDIGPQALKHVWATLLHNFPDLRLTVEGVIAEEDKVVGRIFI